MLPLGSWHCDSEHLLQHFLELLFSVTTLIGSKFDNDFLFLTKASDDAQHSTEYRWSTFEKNDNTDATVNGRSEFVVIVTVNVTCY